MNNRELRKLGRVELMELLVQQQKEIERLRSRLEENIEIMEDQQLRLEELYASVKKGGTLAEAALILNDVFGAADAAAKQYVEEIRARAGQVDDDYRQKTIDEAKSKADAMIASAQRECELMKQDAEKHWYELSNRLERFYREHRGLKEILQYTGIDEDELLTE